jgi:type IV secretion system protein VirB10
MSAPLTPADAQADAAAPVAPPSPDGFRLSGDPPRVMRLSRRAIAIIGAGSGLAIAGALIYALQTSDPKTAPNLYETETQNRSEVVTGAAADYRRYPKLGDPLPGDLGRPILAAQREGEMQPPPAAPLPPVDPRVTAAEQARARVAQEGDAARSSQLFLAAARADAAGAASAAAVPSNAAGQQQIQQVNATENAARLKAPSSPHVIQAGSVIPAALLTGISSDLPGQITAQVTQNVYDSPTGTTLLIPQGARLIGTYGSDIAAGQDRLILAWDRLILPGGRSLDLGRQPGADASGTAGLADRTDHHWGHMVKAALISTLLGAGAELGTGSDDRLIRALREGTQDSIGETGRQLVSRQIAIPPTITIRPGFEFRVIVTRDLILEPVALNTW